MNRIKKALLGTLCKNNSKLNPAIETRKWEIALDSLDELIAVLDKDHCILNVNKSMANVLGKKNTEVIGSTRYLSSHGLDNKQKALFDFSFLQNHLPVTGRFYEESQQAYYEVKLKPYYGPDNSKIIGYVFIARDISNF